MAGLITLVIAGLTYIRSQGDRKQGYKLGYAAISSYKVP